MPLLHKDQESGVGRWYTIKLATLSFYEYLRLKNFLPSVQANDSGFDVSPAKLSIDQIIKLSQHISQDKNLLEKFQNIFLPNKRPSLSVLPCIKSLCDLFEWPQSQFYKVSELASSCTGLFHDYLIRGGFPQTAQVERMRILPIGRVLKKMRWIWWLKWAMILFLSK